MHLQLTHSRPSFSIILKAWLIEHLERFEGKIYKWLVEDLTSIFDKSRLLYKAKIQYIQYLSIPSAEYKLLKLGKVFQDIEKLESMVSDLKNDSLKQSFKGFISVVYSYEAKLRIHINSKSEIIPTPDYIKNQLSDMSKRSIGNSAISNQLV
ncbi:hypothetical protein [Mucilaginibacter endophyticus]|uniref:hypothetical protein n=1 Tax=Mucilaginibacter endophyticus TaxID=2675003 RepID=UPI0012B17CBB|nr:hypothetical protein [Mucilaginibacter endophyticus]